MLERLPRHRSAENADAFCRGIHPPVLLHALPEGFQRIRYYGLLGNRYRQEKLAAAANYCAWHLR